MNDLTEPARVRPARLADVEGLCEIEARAFDPQLYALLSRRQFTHLLKSGSASFGVFARPDGQPDGYALVLFRRNSRAARFYSLAVDPLRRGTGIGRALFEWAEAEALRRGATRLLLEIREDNKALLERYARQGYAPYRRVPGFYPDGVAALKMQRSLEGERASSAHSSR